MFLLPCICILSVAKNKAGKKPALFNSSKQLATWFPINLPMLSFCQLMQLREPYSSLF
jgi:hypothetical protein